MSKSKSTSQQPSEELQIDALTNACHAARDAIHEVCFTIEKMVLRTDEKLYSRENEEHDIISTCETAADLARVTDVIQDNLAIPFVRSRLDAANEYPVEIGGQLFESYVFGITAIAWTLCDKLKDYLDRDKTGLELLGRQLVPSDLHDMYVIQDESFVPPPYHSVRTWLASEKEYFPQPTPRIECITPDMIGKWYEKEGYDELCMNLQLWPDAPEAPRWQRLIDSVDENSLKTEISDETYNRWRRGCKAFSSVHGKLSAINLDSIEKHIQKEFKRACRVNGLSLYEVSVPLPSSNEERDTWLYEQCVQGIPYSLIRFQLEQRKDWEPLATLQGIRRAAQRYALKNGLPPIPLRQPGRRSGP